MLNFWGIFYLLRENTNQMIQKVLIVFLLFFNLFAVTAQEDELGNWLMYFGTNRISDDFSIHSEVQYRNHKVAPVHIEQLLLRTGLNYHLSNKAIVTLGYGYIPSYIFESEQKPPESKEHRIFQQFILKNSLNRFFFEHRYRLEQRWVNSDYRNRFRYRLMLTVPLNQTTISKNAIFLALYDEIFIGDQEPFFDRNRLYGAVGYQALDQLQLQIGYLQQRIFNYGKGYLQLAIVYNTDFRKGSD